MATSKARRARRAAGQRGDFIAVKQWCDTHNERLTRVLQYEGVIGGHGLPPEPEKQMLVTQYNPDLGVPGETVMDDGDPVYGDYMYVVDGRVTRSDVFGTVRTLKRDEIEQGRSAGEVRRCNIYGRVEKGLDKMGFTDGRVYVQA